MEAVRTSSDNLESFFSDQVTTQRYVDPEFTALPATLGKPLYLSGAGIKPARTNCSQVSSNYNLTAHDDDLSFLSVILTEDLLNQERRAVTLYSITYMRLTDAAQDHHTCPQIKSRLTKTLTHSESYQHLDYKL